MATVKTPLFSETYTGIDGAVLNDKQARRVNCYLDDLGAVSSFPASSLFYDFTSPVFGASAGVDGLKFVRFTGGDRLLVSIGGGLYSLAKSGATYSAAALGAIPGAAGLPLRFASDRTNVLIATGNSLAYGTISGVVGVITSGTPDALGAASHVVMMDGYAIANVVGTNTFRCSDLNDSLTWPADKYASAAGDNDTIQAIAVRNRELFIFGKETTEVWENVGATPFPFQRVAGGFVETGCIAPYSVCVTDEGIYWLNHKRRLVMYDGANVKQISTQFDAEISSWGSVSDCQAEAIDINGTPFLWFYFPGERRILCLNQSNNTWSERAYWDAESGAWDNYFGRLTCYVPEWGVTVIGDRAAPTIYKMDSSDSAYAEGALPGALRLYQKSGNLDYGTSKRKRSNCLRIRIRKVRQDTYTDPVYGKLLVRWRDDGRDAWSNTREIDLGFNSDSNLIVEIHRTGIYKTRQYEIYGTPRCRTIFCDAEEDIEVLAR